MSNDRLSRWLNQLLELDVAIQRHEKFHRHMAVAINGIVVDLYSEEVRTEISDRVKLEDPKLFELFAIISKYTTTPNDLFDPLERVKLFKSCNFYIKWSSVFEQRGKFSKAAQVLRRGMDVVKPTEFILLQIHYFRLMKMKNIELLTPNNDYHTTITELCTDLVELITKLIGNEQLVSLPPLEVTPISSIEIKLETTGESIEQLCEKLSTEEIIESLNKSVLFFLTLLNNDPSLPLLPPTSQMQVSGCPPTSGTSGSNLLNVNGRKNSTDDEQSVDDDGDHDISKSKRKCIETTNDRLKVVGTPLFKYGGKEFDNEEDLNLELLSDFEKFIRTCFKSVKN